jgi:hypothetical protein
VIASLAGYHDVLGISVPTLWVLILAVPCGVWLMTVVGLRLAARRSGTKQR